jgi:hypothetical protein
MTLVITPAKTPVFVNADGVNAPEGGTEIGWTVQGTAAYVKGTNYVFATPDQTRTPANVFGWTVQNANTGSDENLVQNAGA